MNKKVAPVPAGYHTAIPYLVVRGAARAIEFYKNAFAAEEMFRMPTPDGRLAHAEIRIGDSVVMLSDEMPEMGYRSPEGLGGTATSILLYLPEVDQVVERALKAGAKSLMPVADQFWGDRMGKVADPFGHHWTVATHIEDVSPEEMDRRAKAAFGGK